LPSPPTVRCDRDRFGGQKFHLRAVLREHACRLQMETVFQARAPFHKGVRERRVNKKCHSRAPAMLTIATPMPTSRLRSYSLGVLEPRHISSSLCPRKQVTITTAAEFTSSALAS